MPRRGLIATLVLSITSIVTAQAPAPASPPPAPAPEPAPAQAQTPAEPDRPAPGSRTITPLDTSPTLFRNVHIITMTDAGTLRNHDLLVRDGRIQRLQPASSPIDDPAAHTIDGRGELFLIPGLCDFHLHFPPVPGENRDAGWRAATLLLAHGVTTARGMIGHPSHLALRRRIIAGDLLGPTVHIAGPPVVFQVAKFPEQAETIVEEQADIGFDFIKSHRVISHEIFATVHDAARRFGIPVTGHVDNEVGLDRALPTGMQIEHLDAFFAALLTDPAKADTFGQMPTPGIKPFIDVARIPDVADDLAKARIWCGPTMALFRNIARAHEPADAWNNRDELRYIMPQAREMWIKQRDSLAAQGPFRDPEFATWFIDTRAAMLRALHDKNVRLLACSDSPQAFLVTGLALHDELQTMVDAGLPPHAVLAAATATANPAAYFDELVNKGSALGLAPDFGTIAPGRRADLVLLTANPLDNIANTRRIDSVMLRGKLLNRAALDDLLKQVEASVKS